MKTDPKSRAYARRLLNAFSLDTNILIDTGSPDDLVSLALALRFAYHTHKVSPITFKTANGLTTTNEAIAARLSPFNHDPCKFLILQDTPTVATVGGRCARGFTFLWLPGLQPAMVTPELKIVPLDVINDVPYLMEHGSHTRLKDPLEIRRATGVFVSEAGVLQIDVSHSPALAAKVVKTQAVDASSQTDADSARGGDASRIPTSVSPASKQEETTHNSDVPTLLDDSSSGSAPWPLDRLSPGSMLRSSFFFALCAEV